MGRNFQKAIEDGRKLGDKHSRLDISVNEITMLKDQFMKDPTYNGLFNVIVDAFCAGLAIGHRNTKRQIKKER